MKNVTNVSDILDLDESDDEETFEPTYRGNHSRLQTHDFMRKQFMVHDTEGYIKSRSKSNLERRLEEEPEIREDYQKEDYHRSRGMDNRKVTELTDKYEELCQICKGMTNNNAMVHTIYIIIIVALVIIVLLMVRKLLA